MENYLQVNRLNAELRGLEEQVELQEHEQEASISLRLQEVEMSFNQNFRIMTIGLSGYFICSTVLLSRQQS